MYLKGRSILVDLPGSKKKCTKVSHQREWALDQTLHAWGPFWLPGSKAPICHPAKNSPTCCWPYYSSCPRRGEAFTAQRQLCKKEDAALSKSKITTTCPNPSVQSTIQLSYNNIFPVIGNYCLFCSKENIDKPKLHSKRPVFKLFEENCMI